MEARRTIEMWTERGKPTKYLRALSFRLERIDVGKPRKFAIAHLACVFLHRRLDAAGEFTILLHEFRHARRKTEHVLENEDLSVAGGRGTDADRRNRHLLRDALGQGFGDRFDHHRKGSRFGDRA